MKLDIPATTKGPATTIEIEDGEVRLDGEVIGYVFKGEYHVSPKAAGHNRVVRYHASHDEWAALLPGSTERAIAEIGHSVSADFRGGDWKSSRKKNSRKAACAFLVAVASGTPVHEAEYFFWERG